MNCAFPVPQYSVGNLIKGKYEPVVNEESWEGLLEDVKGLQRHEALAGELYWRNILLHLQGEVDGARFKMAQAGDQRAAEMTDEELAETLSQDTIVLDDRLRDAALVLKLCFTLDPTKRPSARELLSMKFFQEEEEVVEEDEQGDDDYE